MDAGNFPNYERIINTTPLPRTRQERGWFFLELSFSPEESTRSVVCPMHLEFTAFGDVCRIEVPAWGTRTTPHTRTELEKLLRSVVPPVKYDHDPATDLLRLELMDNRAAREKMVQGTLIFNSKEELVCLATGLKT